MMQLFRSAVFASTFALFTGCGFLVDTNNGLDTEPSDADPTPTLE